MRRDIPADIKRKVRKKCYFGCVICGGPIYEYEHIVEWSKIKEHTVDNIVLLCPNHHSMVTKGIISKDSIKSSVENPFNKNRKFTEVQSLYCLSKSVDFIFQLGLFRLTFEDELLEGETIKFISLADVDIFYLRRIENKLLINLIVFDEYGVLSVVINDGELMHKVEAWDITFIGTKLIIKNKERDSKKNVEIDITGNRISLDKVWMNHLGRSLIVDKNIVKMNGISIKTDEDGGATFVGSTFKGPIFRIQ